MINNDAVARIHAGKYEDGLRLYQQAIKSLPEGESGETKELITYNLALAYARYGDLEQSLKTMESIKPNDSSKIAKKFQSFYKKVKHSIDTGTKLEFNEAKDKPTEEEEMAEKTISDTFVTTVKKSGITAGSRCCYKIYTRDQGE